MLWYHFIFLWYIAMVSIYLVPFTRNDLNQFIHLVLWHFLCEYGDSHDPHEPWVFAPLHMWIAFLPFGKQHGPQCTTVHEEINASPPMCSFTSWVVKWSSGEEQQGLHEELIASYCSLHAKRLLRTWSGAMEVHMYDVWCSLDQETCDLVWSEN